MRLLDDLLLAKRKSEVDWLGAAINLLVSRGAVAGRVVGGAVEDLAAGAWAQGVAVRREGVAPLAMI